MTYAQTLALTEGAVGAKEVRKMLDERYASESVINNLRKMNNLLEMTHNKRVRLDNHDSVIKVQSL